MMDALGDAYVFRYASAQVLSVSKVAKACGYLALALLAPLILLCAGIHTYKPRSMATWHYNCILFVCFLDSIGPGTYGGCLLSPPKK